MLIEFGKLKLIKMKFQHIKWDFFSYWIELFFRICARGQKKFIQFQLITFVFDEINVQN